MKMEKQMLQFSIQRFDQFYDSINNKINLNYIICQDVQRQLMVTVQQVQQQIALLVAVAPVVVTILILITPLTLHIHLLQVIQEVVAVVVNREV
jgi:hypothetical protein